MAMVVDFGRHQQNGHMASRLPTTSTDPFVLAVHLITSQRKWCDSSSSPSSILALEELLAR
jgi:hypothetical protein